MLFRNALKKIDHFFVQNHTSSELLKTIGITQVTISGDTRFDRVNKISEESKEIKSINEFKGRDRLWVIGSCWPEDFEILIPFILENKQTLKFVIAPHEIDEGFLDKIESELADITVRYSEINQLDESHSVLIFDNVGMLSHLYKYGEFAYIGGAFGKGLHNILEAACQGIPIFFGSKNYKRFNEAIELIERGGAFPVDNYLELQKNYELMVSRPENYGVACAVTKKYVLENLGATQKVLNYVKKYITA